MHRSYRIASFFSNFFHSSWTLSKYVFTKVLFHCCCQFGARVHMFPASLLNVNWVWWRCVRGASIHPDTTSTTSLPVGELRRNIFTQHSHTHTHTPRHITHNMNTYSSKYTQTNILFTAYEHAHWKRKVHIHKHSLNDYMNTPSPTNTIGKHTLYIPGTHSL